MSTTMSLPSKSSTKPLNRKEAAAYLTSIGFPISAKTLANVAMNENTGQGGGPAFYRTNWIPNNTNNRGKRVFYKVEDLIAWASSRIKRVD